MNLINNQTIPIMIKISKYIIITIWDVILTVPAYWYIASTYNLDFPTNLAIVLIAIGSKQSGMLIEEDKH